MTLNLVLVGQLVMLLATEHTLRTQILMLFCTTLIIKEMRSE